MIIPPMINTQLEEGEMVTPVVDTAKLNVAEKN